MTEANFHLLEGRKVYAITKVPSAHGKSIMVEDETRVQKVVSFLREGDVGSNGRVIAQDTVHFLAYEGGNRWLRASDIVDVR